MATRPFESEKKLAHLGPIWAQETTSLAFGARLAAARRMMPLKGLEGKGASSRFTRDTSPGLGCEARERACGRGIGLAAIVRVRASVWAGGR